MLRAIGKRLTYANVIATLALFLALGGGAVWAAQKIGANGLQANSVTTGKIKAKAVTRAKIRNGAVNLEKISAGTNVIAVATSNPVPVNGSIPINLVFPNPASFTPAAGFVYMMNVEARSTNLVRVGPEVNCRVAVYPLVDGNEFGGAPALSLSAVEPSAEEPSGLIPAAGRTTPIGIGAIGEKQSIGATLIGSPRCSAASTATVVVAITAFK